MKRIAAVVAALVIAAGGALAANEIVAQVVLKATKGYLDQTRAVNATHDLESLSIAGGTESITDTAAPLNMAGVTDTGWAYFRNLSTNDGERVYIGGTNATGFVEFLDVGPGEYVIGPIGAAPWARTDTGYTAVLEKLILQGTTTTSTTTSTTTTSTSSTTTTSTTSTTTTTAP
jgi:hypothetical protein